VSFKWPAHARGTIRGRRGDIESTASMHTQAGGSVRVQFNTADWSAALPLHFKTLEPSSAGSV